MKKTIITTVFLTLLCQSLYGIAGFGFTYSNDSYPLDAVDEGWDGLVTINSESSSSATGFGGYVYIDVIPIVDIEAGFDLSGYRKYTYKYSDETVEIPLFQKFGIYGTIQKKIFKLPMVKFFGGIGFSSNTLVPELNEDFFVDSDIDQEATDKILEAVNDNLTTQSGYHLEVGARAKPWLVPVSFNAKARYNFIEDIVPGKNGYLSIIFGAGLAL